MDLELRLQNEIYALVTSLDCNGCPGDCCVSPTMTAPEFVYFMRNAVESLSNHELDEILCADIRFHANYKGNTYCRFQLVAGPCNNYRGRALACRLFGHEVLREYSIPDMEFCTRNPPGNTTLKSPVVDQMLQRIREILSVEKLNYEAPFFLQSLNLESWLDFYFQPEIALKHPALQNLRNYLDRNLQIAKPQNMPEHTQIAQKLAQIERLHEMIAAEEAETVLDILENLLHDFPTCGSYYIDEAKQIKDIILGS